MLSKNKIIKQNNMMCNTYKHQDALTTKQECKHDCVLFTNAEFQAKFINFDSCLIVFIGRKQNHYHDYLSSH